MFLRKISCDSIRRDIGPAWGQQWEKTCRGLQNICGVKDIYSREISLDFYFSLAMQIFLLQGTPHLSPSLFSIFSQKIRVPKNFLSIDFGLLYERVHTISDVFCTSLQIYILKNNYLFVYSNFVRTSNFDVQLVVLTFQPFHQLTQWFWLRL